VTSNEKRARLRRIRRVHRAKNGLPIRRDAGRARPRRGSTDDLDGRDLDTPNPDLIGFTEESA